MNRTREMATRSWVVRYVLSALAALASGCNAIPDVVHEPLYHNPFPQLYRVAVLPFYNQSDDPTVHQERVALAYYNELQKIPGFEVMPVGTAARLMEASGLELTTGEDFQRLAQYLNVDAVAVGAVTDFSPYYPPRMGLAVNWYAANPCFHPIPPGYGLPWGTEDEESIPRSTVFEAEFALAREQLRTQTPNHVAVPGAAADENQPHVLPEPESLAESTGEQGEDVPDLPLNWPDPRGFVPPAPVAHPPPCWPQSEPVMTLTRTYNGHDEAVTQRLAEYYYFRDDARFGGWQAYLQRSDDFIRFCCYLHITEMLGARGGAVESRVVWRWPIGRYER